MIFRDIGRATVVSRLIGTCMEAYFSIKGQEEEVLPFNEQRFDLRDESLRMRYELQISIKQRKS